MGSATSIVTRVDFVSIPTPDLAAAADFYEHVLGLERSSRWQGPGERPLGVEFEAGTVTIALMDVDPFGIPLRPHRVPLALRVDDVAAARAALASRGVTFAGEIVDSGVCHQATFEDPDRNLLDLHHHDAPRPARD